MRRAYTAATAVALAAAGLVGCDSTVGLDTTRSQYTRLIVTGACQPQGLGQIELSTLLLNGPEEALLPSAKLRGQSKTVGEVLRPADFRFSHIASAVGLEKQAYIEDPSMPGSRVPVALNVEGVEFAYPGGEEKLKKPRLVIFLIDHSGSLAGIDKFGAVREGSATDPNDQRVTFFSQLLHSLPDKSDEVSLVWFNDLPHFDAAEPTKNRDIINDALDDHIAFGETGRTELGLALQQTYDSLVRPNLDARRPIVVLFTDGFEGEDPPDLGGVTQQYGQSDVPIVVLDLQGRALSERPQGRDGVLRDLACGTGGDYVFIKNAEAFTDPNIVPLVRNRLLGSWKLKVQTSLPVTSFGQEALLSTTLSATVGESENSYSMENSTESFFNDSRLWFTK